MTQPNAAVAEHETTLRKVPLVEVFRSLQGEGWHAGRDAIFVRLAGCPLACEFAPGVVCDTPYQRWTIKPTLGDLFHEIIPALGSAVVTGQLETRTMLVLTGGEPTASPSFNALVDVALTLGFYVAVETNGTQWRDALGRVHWITVSPKETVPQTSKGPWHNRNPRSPVLDSLVCREMDVRARYHLATAGGEYRHVIGPNDTAPEYRIAPQHFVSPAVLSDGTGEEWRHGFPGFVPGAVERCLEIVRADPRWRLSIQQHKVLRVR